MALPGPRAAVGCMSTSQLLVVHIKNFYDQDIRLDDEPCSTALPCVLPPSSISLCDR